MSEEQTKRGLRLARHRFSAPPPIAKGTWRASAELMLVVPGIPHRRQAADVAARAARGLSSLARDVRTSADAELVAADAKAWEAGDEGVAAGPAASHGGRSPVASPSPKLCAARHRCMTAQAPIVWDPPEVYVEPLPHG
jgi:hypothetical protein